MEETQIMVVLSKAEREVKKHYGFPILPPLILSKGLLTTKPTEQENLGNVTFRVQFPEIQSTLQKLRGLNGRATGRHLCQTYAESALEKYVKLYTQLEVLCGSHSYSFQRFFDIP